MKTIITTLIFALLTTGCVNLRTPDGYAETERTGLYDYKAISTDASVIAVRVHRNQDKKQGTLNYWAEASRKHLVLSRGYEFKESGDFTCDQGKGKWMLFSKKYRGTDYLYMLGLVIKRRKIYAMEAGGEKELFEADIPRVKKAFASLD